MKTTFRIGLSLGLLAPLFASCSGELPGDLESNAQLSLREISVTESDGTTTRVFQDVNNPDIVIEEATTKRAAAPERGMLTACEDWVFSRFGGGWVNRYSKNGQTADSEACAAFPTACIASSYTYILLATCNHHSSNSLPVKQVRNGTLTDVGSVGPLVWKAWKLTNGKTGKYSIQGLPNGAAANFDLLTGTSQN